MAHDGRRGKERPWLLIVFVAIASVALGVVGLQFGAGEPPDQSPPLQPAAATVDTPPPAAAAVVAEVAPGQSGSYTVQQGDTLGSLATRFAVPLDVLAAANGIPNWDLIHPGQVLVIPPPPG